MSAAKTSRVAALLLVAILAISMRFRRNSRHAVQVGTDSAEDADDHRGDADTAMAAEEPLVYAVKSAL